MGSELHWVRLYQRDDQEQKRVARFKVSTILIRALGKRRLSPRPYIASPTTIDGYLIWDWEAQGEARRARKQCKTQSGHMQTRRIRVYDVGIQNFEA